jgi:hypothetical protein
MDDITDSRARELLAAAYDTVPASGELLAGVRRRHARRQMRVRSALATGTAALIAGGVLSAFAVTGAPSALAAVTNAVTKTAAESFRVRLAVTVRNGSPGSPTPSSPFRVAGAFAPARHVGEETMSNGWQMRYLGGIGYLRLLPRQAEALGGKPWLEERVVPSGLQASGLAWDYNSDQIIDPSALLRLLDSAAQIRDEGFASGPGWTGTKYAFTVRNPADIVQSITGTVDVDSDGQLRRLIQIVTFTPDSGPAMVTTLDFTFGDFGAPMSVVAPPASQVGHGRVILGVQY